MSLQDPLNKMALSDHSGGYTIKYKQYVLDYLSDATDGLTGEKQSRS